MERIKQGSIIRVKGSGEEGLVLKVLEENKLLGDLYIAYMKDTKERVLLQENNIILVSTLDQEFENLFNQKMIMA